MSDSSHNATTGPEGPDAPLHRRGIKSYVLRAGRMTQAQTRGLEEIWPRLGLNLADASRDLDVLFGRQAPPVVEVAFGWGASLVEQSDSSCESDFIAMNVTHPARDK